MKNELNLLMKWDKHMDTISLVTCGLLSPFSPAPEKVRPRPPPPANPFTPVLLRLTFLPLWLRPAPFLARVTRKASPPRALPPDHPTLSNPGHHFPRNFFFLIKCKFHCVTPLFKDSSVDSHSSQDRVRSNPLP